MLKKFKTWRKENPQDAEEAIAFAFMGAVMVGVLGTLCYIVKKDYDFQADQAKEAIKEVFARNEIIENALKRGDTVLPNPDGSFWILPKNADPMQGVINV